MTNRLKGGKEASYILNFNLEITFKLFLNSN